MLCKFKLTQCCCWRWSKSEEVSDDDKKESTRNVDNFKIEDEESRNGDDIDDAGEL